MPIIRTMVLLLFFLPNLYFRWPQCKILLDAGSRGTNILKQPRPVANLSGKL